MTYRQWAISQNIAKQNEKKRRIRLFGGENDGGWSDYKREEMERDEWRDEKRCSA